MARTNKKVYLWLMYFLNHIIDDQLKRIDAETSICVKNLWVETTQGRN